MLKVRDLMEQLEKLDPDLPVAVPDIANYDDLALREAQHTGAMLLHQLEGDDTFSTCSRKGEDGECRCDPEQKGPRVMTAVIAPWEPGEKRLAW